MPVRNAIMGIKLAVRPVVSLIRGMSVGAILGRLRSVRRSVGMGSGLGVSSVIMGALLAARPVLPMTMAMTVRVVSGKCRSVLQSAEIPRNMDLRNAITEMS